MNDDLQKYFSIIKMCISIIENEFELDDLYGDLEQIDKCLVKDHSDLMKLTDKLLNTKAVMFETKNILDSVDIFNSKNKTVFENLSTKLLGYMREYRIYNEKYSFVSDQINDSISEQDKVKEKLDKINNIVKVELSSIKKVLDNTNDFDIDDNSFSSKFFLEFALLSKTIGSNFLNLYNSGKRLNAKEKNYVIDILTTIRNCYTSSVVMKKSINKAADTSIVEDYFYDLYIIFKSLNDNESITEEFGNTANMNLINSLYVLDLNKKYSDKDINLPDLYGEFDEDLSLTRKLLINKKA